MATSNTDIGTQLVTYAVSTYKGQAYTWGNLDCSGLVQRVFAQFGISLPRVSSQQWSSGVPVSLDQLQPGDLVFYSPGTAGAPAGLPGHVAIYVGGGEVFQALNPSTPLGFAPVNQGWASPMGARRVIGVAGGGSGSLAASGAPVSSQSGTTQTVSTGSGSTCAWALGTKNKILIWNVGFSVCIFSKTEVRAFVGALMMAAGGVVTMVGVGVTMQYALDKSGVTAAVTKSFLGDALMVMK